MKTPNSGVSVKDQVPWFWPVWKCSETCSSFRVLGWAQYFYNLWPIAFSFLSFLLWNDFQLKEKWQEQGTHLAYTLPRALVFDILPHLFICFCSIYILFFSWTIWKCTVFKFRKFNIDITNPQSVFQLYHLSFVKWLI